MRTTFQLKATIGFKNSDNCTLKFYMSKMQFFQQISAHFMGNKKSWISERGKRKRKTNKISCFDVKNTLLCHYKHKYVSEIFDRGIQ